MYISGRRADALVLHNHVRLVTMCGATTSVRFAIRIDEERLLRECAARAIEVLRLEPWHSSCVALIDGAPRVGWNKLWPLGGSDRNSDKQDQT